MYNQKYRSNYFLIPDQHVVPPIVIHESRLGLEHDLVKQWFSLKLGQKQYTRKGNKFIIMDHGKQNNNQGPDIKGAVLYTNSRIIKGDIECHIYERDWYNHGHVQDETYLNVILHIVRKVTKHNPTTIPTFVIPVSKFWNCTLNTDNVDYNIVSYLQHLGTLRWQEKVQACRKENALEQLAKPLGYGGNEIGFLQLIKSLQSSVLLNLPPNKRIDYMHRKAENIAWEHCGIRPAQWPERRFELLAELISATADNIVKKPITKPNDLLTKLINACPSGGRTILIEACVNYFYPLMAAKSLDKNNHMEYKKWFHGWQELKLQHPYGRIAKKYGIFLTRSELCTVGITQGLLYLEKEFCPPRYCSCCPLKKTFNDFKN